MKSPHHRERGATLIETALVLPVLLGALYAVVWGIRVGVVTERSEQVVRYAGVVQQQQNPYVDYSLYTLYNNLDGASNVPTQPCAAANSNFVLGGSVANVVGTAFSTNQFSAFFLPTSFQVNACTAARVNLTSGFSRGFLMLTESPSVSATVNASFAGILPGATALGTHTFTRKMAFYRSPDLSSLLHCSPQLSAVITASLEPSTDGSSAGVTLPLVAADATPLTFTSNCNSGAGAPVPIPSQSPFMPTPPPTATPATSPVPTKQPTQAPTSTPTDAPTAAPTPSPAPTPTTGTGTGGGGGGGGSTPAPTAAPTTAPTAKPTTPPTAAPTAAPTAKPTAKPTAAPTPTPQPPSGPVS